MQFDSIRFSLFLYLAIVLVILSNYYPIEAARKSDLSEDNDDEYNEYTDENENSKQLHHHSEGVLRRIGTTYNWGRWEKWTKCTSSCVQIKQRKCIERTQNENGTIISESAFYPNAVLKGCYGILKRFRMCKDERCKGNKQRLRDEQCEKYNKIPYKGNFYNWLGYEKEHNECELYCRQNGSDIIQAMNQSVTDGTTCNRPAVFYTHYYRRRAVCVEGICRGVHTTGAIRPATTNDAQLKCGSVLCEHISEIYEHPRLPLGFHVITTIPVGAMNLSIKQIMPSDNLLTLKSVDDFYILNADHRQSDSGIYEFNEDVYDYNKDVGVITSKGPLNKPILLVLFVLGSAAKVQYNYTIPVPSATITQAEELQTHWNELGEPISEADIENSVDASVAAQLARVRDRKRRKFSWKLLGFGQCNRSCGPGVQTPIFRCIRDSPMRFYSPKRCAFAEKPVFSEDIYHCNRGLCPPYWRLGNYSECKCEEGASEGLRTRFVKCVQEQIKGNIEDVAERLCTEKAPELHETCSCPLQARRRIYERVLPEKSPRVYSRLLSAPLQVRSVYNSSAPLRRNLRDNHNKHGGNGDKAGTWLASEWRGECHVSSACNPSSAAFQVRSIYCDRAAPKSDLCDLHFTPEQKRACPDLAVEPVDQCFDGTWYSSEWSNCTGDCFSLQRTRTVLCLLDEQVVEDVQCDVTQKPKNVKTCQMNEVNYCGPQWHYSEWSECSRSCGEGIQRRYAKCLDYDWKQNMLIESNNCKYLEREPVYGSCNTHKCEDSNPSHNAIQNEPDLLVAEDKHYEDDSDCSDEFRNCERINRQRLCRLPYYKTYCCQSCRGYH